MLKKLGHLNADLTNDLSAALLDAARTIFVSEGVKGLSVRRVAEHAGCTTMAVYSRFKGKDGILGALFDEGFDMLSRAQHEVDARLKNEDRLLAFCQAYRATAQNYPHHYALMLGHDSGELTPSQDSQAKALATLNYLTETVAAMACMKGQSHLACAETANLLFAFCHGWVSLERVGFLGGSQKSHPAFNKAVMALVITNTKKKKSS